MQFTTCLDFSVSGPAGQSYQVSTLGSPEVENLEPGASHSFELRLTPDGEVAIGDHAITVTYKVAGAEPQVKAVSDSWIAVEPDNRPPVANDDVVEISGRPFGSTDTSFNFFPAPGVLANDFDGDNDPIVARLRSLPIEGSLCRFGEDGFFCYHPPEGFEGEDSFTYYVFDGKESSNTATVRLNVTIDP